MFGVQLEQLVYAVLDYSVFISFIDDYSHLTWLYGLKNCSQVFDAFKSFYAEITNHFNGKLQKKSNR